MKNNLIHVKKHQVISAMRDDTPSDFGNLKAKLERIQELSEKIESIELFKLATESLHLTGDIFDKLNYCFTPNTEE
jgi:hypothetical protein